MTFSADGLPAGLKLDPATGQITGTLTTPGEIAVTFHAANANGQTSRPFKIVVGDEIGLTPALGWSSWNCWGNDVDQDKVLKAAQAMVKSGLSQHGWTYINTDDTWQGARGGDFNGIQADSKFPDIKGMVDQIHALGLKAGIYSSPWVTSYDGHVGGSSENPDGAWDAATMTQGGKNRKVLPFAIGKYHFDTQDAKQWAAWGFDYLKYDWAPVEAPETAEMADALKASGRDMIFSLSNNSTHSLLAHIADVSKLANSWRTSKDITDNWGRIREIASGESDWASVSRPGHFNDPDMLVVGSVFGWGKPPHPSRLTPDEQYTHISLWCLLAGPLIIGCDLDQLDPFTYGLLSNDEVLDVDQDSLGKQATEVSSTSPDQGDLHVYAKPLDDGSWAVGLFNLGATQTQVTVKWTDLGLSGRQMVRDLWRQKDVGTFDDQFSSPVPSHGVVLVRVSKSGP
jgi:alpha-galactosidase